MTVQNTLCMESCSWSRIHLFLSYVGLKSHRLRGGGRRREEGSQAKEKKIPSSVSHVLGSSVCASSLLNLSFITKAFGWCAYIFLSSYPLLLFCELVINSCYGQASQVASLDFKSTQTIIMASIIRQKGSMGFFCSSNSNAFSKTKAQLLDVT